MVTVLPQLSHSEGGGGGIPHYQISSVLGVKCGDNSDYMHHHNRGGDYHS